MVLITLCVGACQQPLSHSAFIASPVSAEPVDVVEADTPPEFGTSSGPRLLQRPTQTRLDTVLRVLHVQIPSSRRGQAATLWNHVHEDALDVDTRLRLGRNGVRAAIGHNRWWEAIKATFDAIEGAQTVALDPVRLPEGYPLALQLDSNPHEQTLFFVAEDGVLSGETWPGSRNVLRVSCALDLEHPECLHLAVVPEVRQRLDGWRWVRHEAGLTQLPKYEGRAFAAAGFVADLEPGQFVVLAPGERADVYGIVGGAFLVQELNGTRYDSYVFLRADVNHVACRN